MHQFFYPLLSELKEIFDDGGIDIVFGEKKYNFLPLLLQFNSKGTYAANGWS